MAALDIDTALDWRGRTVLDCDGEKIGKFEELYLDDGDRPAWAAVTTGLFGLRQSFVPLDGARLDGDDLRVPYGRDQVKDAPNIDPDEQLSSEEENLLERHYAGDGGDGERAGEERAGEDPGAVAAQGDARRGDSADRGDSVDRDGADDRGDSVDRDGADDSAGDDAMTRSEEELHVGTRTRERGRAKLKKYVVTEHVTKTVPVQREEVRLEYEPNTEDRGDEQRDA